MEWGINFSEFDLDLRIDLPPFLKFVREKIWKPNNWKEGRQNKIFDPKIK